MKRLNFRLTHKYDVLFMVANLVIIAYVLYLLVAHIISQQSLNRSAELRFVREAEMQAGTLGYFLTERQRDVTKLAAGMDVQAFFQNRAMGMSMQYGLRASLTQIAHTFGQVLSERGVPGGPLFSWLRLVTPDGTLLVENNRVAEAGRTYSLFGVGSAPLMHYAAGECEDCVQISAPVFFKSNRVGYVLAGVSLSPLMKWVNKDVRTKAHLWLGLYDGDMLMHSTPTLAPNKRPPRCPDASTADQLCYAADWLSYRGPVPGTPFHVQVAAPANTLVGSLHLGWMILGIGAAGVAALIFFITIVRQTQRQRVEDELRASEEYNRALLSAIPDAIFVFDQKGAVLDYREGGESGIIPAQQLINQPVEAILPAALAGQFRAALTTLMTEHAPQVVEYQLTGNNKTFDYECLLVAFGDDKALAISRNITEHKRIQNELAAQQERLAYIIDGTHVGTWEWNVYSGEVLFNERWAHIAGYTLEELAPTTIETWTALAHPDDLKRSEELLRQHFEGITPYYECECRMKHRNGDWIWVLDRGKVTRRSPDGTPLSMSGTHTDITSRKNMEDELRDSESNFRTFFESMDDMIFVGTLDGAILYTNRTVEQKLGYSSVELAAMHLSELHPSDKKQEAEAIFAALFRGEQDTCTLPLPLECKDHRQIPVLTHVWRGKWDGVGCFFGVSKDLSAQQEAQQRFEQLFRNNPALMTLTSLPDRIFTDVNDAFLHALGYSRSEVLGKTAGQLGLFPHPEQHQFVIHTLFAKRRISDYELQIARKDGSILSGLFSGEMITSQGKQYFLSVLIDITTRKQAEIELEQHAQLETLMAMLSMQFINLNPDETEQRIQESLQGIGQTIGVDRVYMFNYTADLQTCSNTYEWCENGVVPQIDSLQEVPANLLPWWTEQMKRLRNIVISDVAEMPPEATAEQQLLQAQDIKSLLVVPLSWGGKLEGFIGFDSVRAKKDWSDEDVAPLELLAGIIHNAIKHKEGEQQLYELNSTLEQRVEIRTRELHDMQTQMYLQEKMASVGQLAAGLAHEINNPVSFVATNFATLEEDMKAFSTLLKAYRTALDDVAHLPDVAKHLETIKQIEQNFAIEFILNDLPNLFAESHDGIKRITTIIGNMRNFARKDAEDDFAPFSLNKGIQDTLIITRNAYKYRAEIILELADLPDINGVAGQINQVLLNLIVNAAQALNEMEFEAGKKGTITIRTGREGNEVYCQIEDNGPGIPDDVVSHIFDPFFTTKAPGEGTGLGLSISYEIIVNKHHGSLSVCRGAEGGTCFRLGLPIQQQTGQLEAKEA